jgi:uncharacterized protein YqgC (DUF456 family)
MDPIVLQVAGALLVLVGLAGTVLPILPGALLIFAGLFLAAMADDFARVGMVGLGIIAALGLLSVVADFVASLLGAKRVGASPQALFGAAAGGIVGLFFGIPGMLLGPFFGAVLGEFIAKRHLVGAGRVGVGTWIGLIVAAVAKVVLGVLMVATFFAFYLLG